MAAVAERHGAFVAAFEAFRRDPAFGRTPGLAKAREEAFGRFLGRGLPSTREEEWRFTSVAPVATVPFGSAAPTELDARAVTPFALPDTATLVIVNGRFAPSLSSVAALPAGVSVTASQAVSVAATPAVTTVFVDLNAAFFGDELTIRIAARSVVSAPIHLIVIAAPGTTPMLVAPRLRLEAGEASECTVVESYVGIGSAPVLTTAVTRLELGPSALVRHVKVQSETASTFHFANLSARLDRASTFTSQALTFGGRISRNDIGVVLDGEGAECTLSGLYLATGERLVDTHTTIDHAKPHCPSHEIYKGIIGGRAKAVFNGKIIVRPQAQKTDAKQTNKALLLSDDAQVDTKPQLEIFADDVKCTHGAAVGQLDEDALFYLRARGLAEAEARHMLIEAFAGEILDGVAVEAVRDRARQALDASLSSTSHE